MQLLFPCLGEVEQRNLARRLLPTDCGPLGAWHLTLVRPVSLRAPKGEPGQASALRYVEASADN
jgi:hypothetical protein